MNDHMHDEPTRDATDVTWLYTEDVGIVELHGRPPGAERVIALLLRGQLAVPGHDEDPAELAIAVDVEQAGQIIDAITFGAQHADMAAALTAAVDQARAARTAHTRRSP